MWIIRTASVQFCACPERSHATMCRDRKDLLWTRPELSKVSSKLIVIISLLFTNPIRRKMDDKDSHWNALLKVQLKCYAIEEEIVWFLVVRRCEEIVIRAVHCAKMKKRHLSAFFYPAWCIIIIILWIVFIPIGYNYGKFLIKLINVHVGGFSHNLGHIR